MEKRIRLKIISDGVNHDVVDAETGLSVDDVQCVDVSIKPGEPVRALLTLLGPEIEITSLAELKTQQPPLTATSKR